MAEDANPLLDSHCDCLDEVLQSIANTRATIQKCKDCGMPMEGREAENEQQFQLVKSLKSKFFPERV